MKQQGIIIQVIDLLKIDDFYGQSETIDIAKGKFAIARNWKQAMNIIKRNTK